MMRSLSSAEDVHPVPPVTEHTARPSHGGICTATTSEYASSGLTGYWALILGTQCAQLYTCHAATPELRAEVRPGDEVLAAGPADMRDPYARRMVQDTVQFLFLRGVDRELGKLIVQDARPLVLIGATSNLASYFARTRYRSRIFAVLPLPAADLPREALAPIVRRVALSVSVQEYTGAPVMDTLLFSRWAPPLARTGPQDWSYDRD